MHFANRAKCFAQILWAFEIVKSEAVTARFRAELSVDSNPRLRGADDGCAVPLERVLLEVRLMHARSNSVFDAAGDAAAQSRASFKQYAQQTLRLQLPLRGATAFFPITFDEWHFCFAPLLVQYALPFA